MFTPCFLPPEVDNEGAAGVLVLQSRGQAGRLMLMPGLAAAVMLLPCLVTLLLLCNIFMPFASISSLLPLCSSFKPGKITYHISYISPMSVSESNSPFKIP